MGKGITGGIVSVAVLVLAAGTAAADANDFVAQLSGDEQVPPVFEIEARGKATFRLSRDGRELDHELVLNNIKDVVQVHIHCAEVGANGPAGITLFNGASITINGILTQGPITAPEVDNGCGWDNLADVVSDIRDGNAYINVHTLTRLPGEIRGQIR